MSVPVQVKPEKKWAMEYALMNSRSFYLPVCEPRPMLAARWMTPVVTRDMPLEAVRRQIMSEQETVLFVHPLSFSEEMSDGERALLPAVPLAQLKSRYPGVDEVNRPVRDGRYTPHALYFPDVPVTRSAYESFPVSLMMAAPVLPAPGAEKERLEELKHRLEKTLALAANLGHHHVVLDAFGLEENGFSEVEAAAAMSDVLSQKTIRSWFSTVTIAPGHRGENAQRAFEDVF
ncbi:hypothetical protein [Alkalicoccus urumqiensis]|uniref:Uncharacterized protein n=1 Tax=Alkalicoccus urumqiensis TaxID=1548213 RepID=A0A2P6MII7_ALKUR|nr:hypothetical protein [Alkalicoccus urumqiensis]PRO66090.1 hypothetical protein C6I21_07275 [Alkalicoccus urumqiensis]